MNTRQRRVGTEPTALRPKGPDDGDGKQPSDDEDDLNKRLAKLSIGKVKERMA